MLPIAAFAWIVILVFRQAVGRKNKKQLLTRQVIGPGVSAAQRWLLALYLGVLLAMIWLGTSSKELGPVSILLLVLGVAPLFAQAIAVPLGLPRLACAIYRVVNGVGPIHERPGSGALVAARAFMRRPSEGGARFIEAYVRTCLELGTNGAAASAIVAAWRGNREQAASIFRLLAWTDAPCTKGAREIAREYVTADALNQAQWRWLPARDDLDAWAHSRPMALLLQLVRRFARVESAPSDRKLWLSFWLSGHWMAMRPLVEHALHASPPTPVAPIAPNFAAHASLLARSPGSVRKEDVVAAVLSLDQLRDSSPWRARVEQRALALGPSIDASSVQDQMMREAEEDIAAVLLQGDHRALWAPEGATGNAIHALVRDERMRQAEALVGELARRTRERRDLPEAEEWRAWADTKHACVDLQRDGVDAATVFSIAFHTMTAYAVRLVNVRSRRVLAREVFHYARSLANAARATHVTEIADRNVKAMEAYRLPNQPAVEGIPLSDPKRIARWSLRSGTATTAFILAAILGGILVPFAMVLAVLVALAVVCAIWTLLRIFECEHTAEGLVVQGRYGRYVAAPEDIVSVRSGPGPLVRIRLRRVPFGFPHRLLTIAKSNDHARAHAERLRTELRLRA